MERKNYNKYNNKSHQKQELKNMLMNLAQKELQSYVAKKGTLKYVEQNVDKVITQNLKKLSKSLNTNPVYDRLIEKCAYQDSLQDIMRIIRNEKHLRSKAEIMKLAKYLNISVNHKNSYKILTRKIANHIYKQRDHIIRGYSFYEERGIDKVLDPEEIRYELINEYKSKQREGLESVAHSFNIDVYEDESEEDLKRRIISYIIKEKIRKDDKL
jgi:elongation factor P--beta-lysine ligase